MDETYGTRKYEADKIALLGLFVVGLLTARFIASSRYTRPSKAGREIVAEIKRKGISSFLDKQGWQSYFLIKNAAGHLAGFTMDAFIDTPPEAELNIQSAAVVYTRGRYAREQLMFFQSDNSFDEFSWKSEIAGPRGRSHTEIHLRENGVLTVTKLNGNKTEATYKPGSAFIPDFLLDLVLSQMLETDHRKIIVDTINAGGELVEVVISRKTAENSATPKTDAQHHLNISFLGDQQFSQDVYLDNRRRIILMKQKDIYFEPTNRENILKYIPECADYIFDKNKTLEPNQP
jgi:hypothetical protein